MNVLNSILIGLFIVIIITYAVLCNYTTYNEPNIELDDGQKKVLYSTTIFGYLLGFLVITIETNYIVKNHNDNIIFRIIELILILILIFISYYSFIYQESANQGWGKVSSALWPLMVPLTMVSISCTAGIYIYISGSHDLSHHDTHHLIRETSMSVFENNGGLDTSEVYLGTSENYLNKVGGEISEDEKDQIIRKIQGFVFG